MLKEKGLYRDTFEHDACGIGFIVQIDGEASHQLVQDGIKMLENMEHRGGTGIDSCSRRREQEFSLKSLILISEISL